MSQRGVFAIFCALLVAACSDNSEVCSDGEDNDSNGVADCEDSACGVGASCGPNGLVCGSSQSCSVCSGNGGTAEPNGEQTCGDGVDNDCDGAVDCADADCQPQGTQAGRTCDGTGRTCSAPNASGISTCGTTSGGGGGGGSAAIGYIRLDSAEYYVLGALGSGYREQSLLTFQVLASDGGPYAGLPVRFSHESQGGSFIGPVASCTNADPPLCTASGTTDAEGRVGVILHSGTRFAGVSVRAEATGAGTTRSFVAGGLYVVGAKPNGARFSLVCDPKNIPALTETDCLYSHYKAPDIDVWCTATVGDRHDNLIATPTLVGFQTEAGGIPPARFTPEFDPWASDPWLGQALGLLNTYGSPLPFDVEPFPGETRYDVDYGCGLRTTNPRDGLVTVMAFVQGEEGFVDGDLDGRYDEGEPYIDLGEPFLDVDDDGVRDSGEWYHDSNEDGSYTGPNGRWDADTVLWTQTRVLYTGHPFKARDGSGRELFMRLYGDGLGSPPAPTPAAPPFAVYMGPPPTTEFYGVFFADQHLNPLSGAFTTFDAEAFVGNVTAKLTRPSATADSVGTLYRMLYCDSPYAPATCLDGPADQACLAPRCYLQTDVGREFMYGNYATLAVTCAQPGPDTVEVRATVEGVTTPTWISGECLP
jgi:hypothetical protein